MKILVFTSLYPNSQFPNHGIFIRERMAKFVRQSGHEIKVVAPVPYFPPIKGNARWKYSQVSDKETDDGIEVFHPRYLVTPKVGMMFYGVFMFLSVVAFIARLRRTFDFDLIDSHFVYPDGLAGVLLGRYFGKPVTVSARGSDVNLYRTMRLIRPLLRYALKKADGVVAVSRALKTAMVELGVPGDRIAVIPNGVDGDKFTQLSRAEARIRLGLSEGKIVLSVGHLAEVKGFELLVKAMKVLEQDTRAGNLRLVIVGEGGYRKHLEWLIASLGLSSRVLLVGAIAHAQLPTWYNAADLFCLASEREGWPNVLMEALACGIPVLATPVGGVPEILASPELGGFLERNEAAIAKAIIDGVTRQWSAVPFQRFAEAHSWDRVARDLELVFASAIRRKSTSCGVAA